MLPLVVVLSVVVAPGVPPVVSVVPAGPPMPAPPVASEPVTPAPVVAAPVIARSAPGAPITSVAASVALAAVSSDLLPEHAPNAVHASPNMMICFCNHSLRYSRDTSVAERSLRFAAEAFSSVGRWGNQTLSLGDQRRLVDKTADSPEAGNRPANDSEATQLGDVARKAYADRRRRSEIPRTNDLFGEPAWDILLGLFIAGCEGRRLSLAAVCSGAGTPESTALRWIAILENRGMIVREGAPDRAFIKLSGFASVRLADYFRQS